MRGSLSGRLRPLPAAMLALLAACAGTTSGGREAPRAAMVPPVDVVRAAAEPVGWADATLARCRGLGFDARTACYDEVLLTVLREHGVAAAMTTLERIGARDTEMNHHGHVLAHHIGIAAYRGPDQVGAVFAECRPSFQSGCYHGVVQAYFADVQASTPGGATDPARLNAVCADHRGADGDMWLLFQCVHGMGHGLVALHDNHLPRALAGCDLLSDEWEREGCYGGAFMENVVGATMPHHAPRADDGTAGHGAHHDHGQGHGGHHTLAGGGHGEHRHGEHHHAEHHAQGEHHHAEHHHAGPGHGDADAAFKALDPADPHYPCNTLDDRYVYACYSMQTSAVLFWSTGEVQPAIDLCDGAPERARQVCYVSLGRDINAHTHGDPAAAIDACMRVTTAFQPSCLIGVAKNRIDVSADPADGMTFCRAVPRGGNRERCFQAVGEQVAVLTSAPDRRAAFCLLPDADDARACRSGAGLPNGAARTEPAR